MSLGDIIDIPNPNPDGLILGLQFNDRLKEVVNITSVGTEECSVNQLVEKLKSIFGSKNVFDDDDIDQEFALGTGQFHGEKTIMLMFDKDIDRRFFLERLLLNGLIDHGFLSRINFELANSLRNRGNE